MNGLFQVFKNIKYLILCILLSIMIMVTIVLYPNFNLLQTFLAGTDTILSKLNFLSSMLFSNPYYSDFWSLLYLVTISFLSGIGITMSVYIFKQKIRQTRGIGLGMIGTFATLIGVGCTACGSFFVLTILSYFGIAGLVTSLPYHGKEIGLLGIVLLCISIYYMSKNIDKPLVC